MRLFQCLVVAVTLSGLAGPAEAAKNFLRDDLASDVVRFEESLRSETKEVGQGRSSDQMRRDAGASEAKADWRAALRNYSAAIAANSKEASNWLGYAKAALQIDRLNGDQIDWTFRGRIASAAYGAFLRASNKTDEAQALAFLGEISTRQELWRQALNAYRASLDRIDASPIQQTYEDLRAKYGFRILNYSVDSDSQNPRACFQFSEALARGKADFGPYVAVAGTSNSAITTEDQQLCVEGLKHGERYALVLRQGLPSAVGENLQKSADYEIYVRDRAPQVRFTGKNYVLPRVGQEGVPIVSVNTTAVAIEIYRIGDRNLISKVQSGDFLTQMNSEKAKAIADSEGTKLWSGTLDTGSRLNADVVTAFPVQNALPKIEPGVYVMLARTSLSPDDATDGSEIATQWFVVSDLGLTSFSGADGIYGIVRSLATALPLPDVEIRLLARNNEILAVKKTDAAGRVRFDPGLARGTGGLAPGLLIGTDNAGDYNFLDLSQTAFDLTDRGVKGRQAVRSLDTFMYTERGVYRSGETVFITALLRDAQAVAVNGLPLTLVVSRPDGVEYKRQLVEDQGLGGRALSLRLSADAATGTWRVQAFADPNSPALGETTFLVEDYVPERLELKLAPERPFATAGRPAMIDANARYLFGAPGANLDLSGEVIVQPASKPPAGLDGYHFGLEDEAFENVQNELEQTTTTDAKGQATIEVPIPEVTAAKPVEAKIILRAAEVGGRAVERVVTLPIAPRTPILGIKPNFAALEAGATASFGVVALDQNGVRVAGKGLRWSLYRLQNDYQWFRTEGRWSFERVKSTHKIADGLVDVAADALGQISAQVGWGAHRLDIQSDTGADQPVSLSFVVGWSGDATADVPDLAEVMLDKPTYAVGDTLKLRIASHFAGTATVAIVSDKIYRFIDATVHSGDNQVAIPISPDWGAGAYAVVLAHRPLNAVEKRMPGRALGLAWFGIDTVAHSLAVALTVPEKIKPRQTLTLPVHLAGLSPGEKAEVTVAAVDVGILNLTRYELPQPRDFFFGQRQLSVEIRDLYGLLIDGMQGTKGAIRSGGDSGGQKIEGDRPTQEPLSRYSGIVAVSADGTAQVSFDIPAFNGTLRVMAVAWTKTRVGSASADIIVRDPIVIQATLPRFASLADRTQLSLQLENVEGSASDYAVDVDLRGPIVVAADSLHHLVNLPAQGYATVTVPILATGIGTAAIDVTLTGPGLDERQTFSLKIGPGNSELYRRSIRTLAAGESVTISNDLIADFLPGSASVSLAASPLVAIDVAALLQALDHYPYGCSEQIVSRAMPLLYVAELSAGEAPDQDPAVDEQVRAAIERVLSRQDSNGAFGLWRAGDNEDLWLDSFVAEFLTRARERGFAVPQRSFDSALDHLRNFVTNTSEVDDAEKGRALAYAVYVLARNGRPIMGDLRYLVDTKLSDFASPFARAQLGAALSLLGDRGRASSVFASALTALQGGKEEGIWRSDYGSRLRDSAGTLALTAESGWARSELQRAGLVVEESRGAVNYTSTQENTWLVMAAEALAKQAQSERLSLDGAPFVSPFRKSWRGAQVDHLTTTLTNTGDTPTRVVITTAGNPTEPEPALSQGYGIERRFYKLDGTEIGAATVKQGERLVIVLKVTEPQARSARMLLVDHLPGGLEIDNPELVDGGAIAALSFLKKDVEPKHAEYRDDRFVAAFDRSPDQPAFFEVAYVVRAVTPGHYLYPPATAEDMYRPERFGRTGFGSIDVTAR
jgi:alpha-2-macroglobulin